MNQSRARKAALFPGWPFFLGVSLRLLAQFQKVVTLAQLQQPSVGIHPQLGAGVGDVQVAHGQLANAVQRAEGLERLDFAIVSRKFVHDGNIQA